MNMPDFGRQVTAVFDLPYRLYAGTQDENITFILSDQLTLATQNRDPSLPDFSLELVRGANPFLPPQPYGLLDMRVRVQAPPDAAAELVRAITPKAVLHPAAFHSGFLRLDVSASDDEVWAKPVRLAWNGLGVARFRRRLSQETAVFLKNGLRNGTLGMTATAEMEVMGLAPRLAATVEFDTAQMLTRLHQQADAQGQITWRAMRDFFQQPLASLPLSNVSGVTPANQHTFVEAMCDWMRVHYGTFVPAPHMPITPTMRLTAVSDLTPATVQWDLSQPMPVPRVFTLTLNPLAAARELLAAQPIDRLIHETVMPVLKTGVRSIMINTSLPPNKQGILAAGVNLMSPANPPARVHPLVATERLDPPAESAIVQWRFAPDEPLFYEYTTFVITKDASGVQELRGRPTQSSAQDLLLTVADFPVQFVPVEATTAVLALATIHGQVSWPDGQDIVTQPFTLTSEQSLITLTLPQAAADQATMTLEARAIDGSDTLSLGTHPATGLRINRFAFAEYGPHQVEITAVFNNTTPLFAIELLPACHLLPTGQPDDPAHISVVTFTADQLQRTWHWFADTPFRPGYVYRVHNSEMAWSAVQDPFQPLTLDVSAHLLEVQHVN